MTITVSGRGVSQQLVDPLGGPSTPLTTRVLRDIAEAPDATLALLRVLNHEVAPAQLLTPSRLARAAARALRDRPDQIRATSKEIAAALREEVRRARARRKPPPGLAHAVREWPNASRTR